MNSNKLKYEQALKWVIRLETDREAAERGFLAWLIEDDENPDAFSRALAQWRRLNASLRTLAPKGEPADPDLLRRIRLPVPKVHADEEPAQPEQPTTVAAFMARAGQAVRVFAPPIMAAALLMAAVAMYSFRNVEYSTAVGETRTVDLGGNSTVELNTDSVVHVPRWTTSRTVYLKKGEAYFKVVHDDERPFNVFAGNTVVHSIGTEFGVRVYNHRHVMVTVAEGVVALGDDAQGPRVKAGERVDIEAGVAHIDPQSVEAIENSHLWRQGEMDFTGENLATIAAEMNRYNSLQIEIAAPALGQLKLGGRFSTTKPEMFCERLKEAFGIQCRNIGGKITVYEKTSGRPVEGGHE
jgi:transmembrane sensor